MKIEFTKKQIIKTLSGKGDEVLNVVILPYASQYSNFTFLVRADCCHESENSKFVNFSMAADKTMNLSKLGEIEETDKNGVNKRRVEKITLTGQQLQEELNSWKGEKRR